MNQNQISLNDKYLLNKKKIFLTGTQALVRLCLIQRQLDLSKGLNTAGYVSGYRGSPLGGMDKEFNRAFPFLSQNDIKFHPAVNEDLAATAAWGTQQLNLNPGAQYQGVFSMWYGKGPGVDRSGDALRHANLAGSSKYGGVLVLAGDDPACKSSTVPSQSEYALIDASIPILNPTNVQEIIDFGIYGWAMSRFSGCWVGMKCVTDNIDTSTSLIVNREKIKISLPRQFKIPPAGLNIRWPDPAMDQEERLYNYKIPAAKAFANANKLNKITINSPKASFGIISTGKAYLETLQALNDIGINENNTKMTGIRLLKVGMPWPLEETIIKKFAAGLNKILVIEEKRPVIETQIKDQLFHWKTEMRPDIIGKLDQHGKAVFSSVGELNPSIIARQIVQHINKSCNNVDMTQRVSFLDKKDKELIINISKKIMSEHLDQISYNMKGHMNKNFNDINDLQFIGMGVGEPIIKILCKKNKWDYLGLNNFLGSTYVSKLHKLSSTTPSFLLSLLLKKVYEK